MKKLKLFLWIFLLFANFIYSQNPCPGVSTVDYAGKTYHTVQIGSQCWLKENLDVGKMINSSSNQKNNKIIEKYCYDNDSNNCTKYGGLYQWNEAMQYSYNTQGICPSGWHIPTNKDQYTLASTVGDDGNALNAIGQGELSSVGTNTSGFSALMSGYCVNHNGHFFDLGSSAYFWNSTEYDASYVRSMYILFNDNSGSGIYFDNRYKAGGFSVRCLKDN